MQFDYDDRRPSILKILKKNKFSKFENFAFFACLRSNPRLCDLHALVTDFKLFYGKYSGKNSLRTSIFFKKLHLSESNKDWENVEVQAQNMHNFSGTGAHFSTKIQGPKQYFDSLVTSGMWKTLVHFDLNKESVLCIDTSRKVSDIIRDLMGKINTLGCNFVNLLIFVR